MPVSCLGGGDTVSVVAGNFNCAGGEPNVNNPGEDDHVAHAQQQQQPRLEVVMTSSVLNAAEQFAFMQQTLLLQIFRDSRPTLPPATAGNSGASNNGRISVQSSASSGSSSSSSASPSCPTCAAFSDQCCQAESGADIFQDFVEINLQCYWDARLSEALAALR